MGQPAATGGHGQRPVPADRGGSAFEIAQQFRAFSTSPSPIRASISSGRKTAMTGSTALMSPSMSLSGTSTSTAAALWPSDNSRNPSAQHGQIMP